MSPETTKQLARIVVFLMFILGFYTAVKTLSQYMGLIVYVVYGFFILSFVLLAYSFFIEMEEQTSLMFPIAIALLCAALIFSTFPDVGKLVGGTDVKILQLTSLLPSILTIVLVLLSFYVLRMNNELILVFVKAMMVLFIITSVIYGFALLTRDFYCVPNTPCHLFSEMLRVFISSAIGALGVLMFIGHKVRRVSSRE